MEAVARKPCPSAVRDEEWAFVAPSLTLLTEEAPQRAPSLRAVCNGLRWLLRAAPLGGCCPTICRRGTPCTSRRGAGSRRTCSGASPRSCGCRCARLRDARAGYDGARRRKGSKAQPAVDTPGHLPTLTVTAADERERAPVGTLATAVQAATGETVRGAFVGQGSTGAAVVAAAAEHGIRVVVVKHQEAKRGCVLLPRRRVVERSLAWLARFRRLARDYARLPELRKGLHLLAFAILFLTRFITAMSEFA